MGKGEKFLTIIWRDTLRLDTHSLKFLGASFILRHFMRSEWVTMEHHIFEGLLHGDHQGLCPLK